jgi:hypothetical protein
MPPIVVLLSCSVSGHPVYNIPNSIIGIDTGRDVQKWKHDRAPQSISAVAICWRRVLISTSWRRLLHCDAIAPDCVKR